MGPVTVTNPSATLADLSAVDSAFGSAAFLSLQQLGGFIAPAAPLPLARIGAVARSALPPRPGSAGRTGVRQVIPRQDYDLLAGLASAAVPVLPDTLLGKTFEWSPDSVRYLVTTRSGAPLNGVRFILYAADPFGFPDPAHEVGSLDIIDHAPAAGAQLEFVLRGVGDTPVYLDYTLTFLTGPSGSAVTVQASGFVSNGAPGAAERRITFSLSITITETAGGGSLAIDVTYDVNVPDVRLELHLGITSDTLMDTGVLSIDFRFTRRNEALRLFGADTLTSGGNTENGTFVVSVNSRLYATLTITDNTETLTNRSGGVVPIDDTDNQYEDDIVSGLLQGVGETLNSIDDVLSVPSRLLGFTLGL